MNYPCVTFRGESCIIPVHQRRCRLLGSPTRATHQIREPQPPTKSERKNPSSYAMAGKKVLIVYAHQEPRSFNGSLKNVTVDELSRQGCTVTVSDLYAMNFEPRATRKDITGLSLLSGKLRNTPVSPVVMKKVDIYGAQHLLGALSNPEVFSYGVEMYEAYKKRSLPGDITDEQKKVQEADLVIFQFPLYWFSVPAILKGWMDRVLCQGFAFDIPGFYDSGLLQGKLALLSVTTGGTAEMYTKTGVSGDFRYFLWPLQHGTLHFCGFKVLAPQINFAPEIASEEERKGMVAAWAQRLQTIWKEEPIPCTVPWYFGQ
ncbi:ribosyldihydronicotinamide dehydrogenase [quinone] isoform X1 [Sapajus apella]|uniref:Ribosyldihydronicotinamide dehydrogenase [quinone] n=4 Tax=Sapajus apella TaxID=9515 RepID=A0A6J3FKX0_SAPAP|nr:ribosyldihydronicotinamide dehydrogenase [quinone] isoform X1 [Sapajus apella]